MQVRDGLGRAGMGEGTHAHARDKEYDGNGIWYRCQGCEAIHKTEEPAAFRDLVEAQCEELENSSRALYHKFGISDPDGRWGVTPNQARFTFTNADGSQCHARYGLMGSYDAEAHNWMWGWYFPEDWMDDAALQVANRLYAFGYERNWQPLIEPILYLNEHEAWHMTKLGAYVSGFPMVYRARVNERNWHYYAIDQLVWESERPSLLDA